MPLRYKTTFTFKLNQELHLEKINKELNEVLYNVHTHSFEPNKMVMNINDKLIERNDILKYTTLSVLIVRTDEYSGKYINTSQNGFDTSHTIMLLDDKKWKNVDDGEYVEFEFVGTSNEFDFIKDIIEPFNTSLSLNLKRRIDVDEKSCDVKSKRFYFYNSSIFGSSSAIITYQGNIYRKQNKCLVM